MTVRQYEHLDMGGAVKVLNEPDPTDPQDVATKNYVDSRGALPPAPQETTLAGTTAWTTQGVQPILSGTIVPQGTSGRLLLGGAGESLGIAQGALFMFYGTRAFPLYQSQSLVGGPNPQAGVTMVQCGKVGFDITANFGREVVLTGLTPGTPVNWSLMLAITGGSTLTHPLTGAYCLKVLPDRSKIYVTDRTNAQVAVVNLGGTAGNTYFQSPKLEYSNSLKQYISVGTNPTGLAVTPDGSKVIVCNQGSGTVTVINTATDTIQGTYTVPGTGPLPTGVCCPNNTTAYVTDYQNGKVYPVTLSNGTMGTAITVGANPALPCATPDGTEVYVPNSGAVGATTVSVITVATNTVAATVTLIAGYAGGAYCCAPMPDSSAVWVAVQGAAASGGQRIYEIVKATHAVGVVSDPNPVLTVQYQDISIDPQGLTAWVADAGGHGVQYWVRNPTPQGGGGGPDKGHIFAQPTVVSGGNFPGVFVDSWGFIYFADNVHSQFFEYPGAFFQIAAGSAFNDDYLSVVWEDAA